MFAEDQPHCGCRTVNRTDENVEKFRQADHRRTIDEISKITNVS